MNIQPPLQRLLARLADPAAARRFVPLSSAAITAHSDTLRGLVTELFVTDFSESQIAALTGALAMATPDLLSELAELVTDVPAAGKALELKKGDIEGLLALLLNLSALERGFAAVYEGADNAVLLCTSTADDDLQTVEAAARAGVDGRSKLGPADRQLVLNRVGELAQMLRTFSMPDEIPGAAPTVTALREEDDERGARDRFLAAIGAGQGEIPANDKLAHRAKSGAAPR